MIRILLADDFAIVREGLRALLENQPDMQVVALADSGSKAVRLVDELDPDVVIMDISISELSGIEAMQKMLKHHPDLKVVVLSINDTSPYIIRALNAGAGGYLFKESAGLDVVEAVRVVIRGERYLSQQVLELLDADAGASKKRRGSNPLEKLSSRELEVLQLVAEGKTSQEIAELLSISPKTVDTYRSRLMGKINVKDITGLVKFAVRNGVVSLD